MKAIMSRQMFLITASAIFVFYLGNCATSQPGGKIKLNETKGERTGWVLRDDKEAIAKAREVFGIASTDSHPTDAHVVTLEDDKTPFLRDQIIKRPVWRLTISKYRLRPKSAAADVLDPLERTFDILLDPQDGKLLKISSRWPEGVPESAPESRAAFAEERMAESGREKYLGFPDAAPAVNFLQALDSIYSSGGVGGDPLVAKQIVAHYVMESRLGREPQAVWAINLRGIPPIRPHLTGVVSVAARDHMRHIVDANTGKWLCAGTSPQPEEPTTQPYQGEGAGRIEEEPGPTPP